MNFWVFEITIKDAFIVVGILTLILLLSNVIRRKVSFIKKSLLPTAVVGGIIMLTLKSFGLLDSFINFETMVSINGETYNPSQLLLESITYHALAIGFIALALKSAKNDKSQGRQRDVLNTGLVTVNTYVIQGIIGLSITLFLASTLVTSLFPAAGLLLPMGFGQGSGQALNIGRVFEGQGFAGGASFGLTIAAIGFLVASLVGVTHMIIQRKKGKLKVQSDRGQFITTEIIASPNEIPMTESIDRFTIQISLIILVYFITFLFMMGLNQLPLGNFGTDTLMPLVWGFNFLIGTLLAILIKQFFKVFKKYNLMTREYPNNYLLNRISGYAFDVMIIAGIGAIQFEVLKALIIIIIIIASFGTAITYFYVRFATNKLFPEYKNEAFLSLFGMLTGTASTGMILLREVDPKFETPAASNLVFQSGYAIAFGFPLFLLLGYAPKGMYQSIMTLGALILMSILFNIFLFRRQLFKKKINTNNQ